MATLAHGTKKETLYPKAKFAQRGNKFALLKSLLDVPLEEIPFLHTSSPPKKPTNRPIIDINRLEEEVTILDPQ